MASRLTLDLVGVTEIAQMFGVNRVTVSKWRAAGTLPAPDAELTRRPLWLRSTIERWAERTGRRLVA
jgi:hypothetical protein